MKKAIQIWYNELFEKKCIMAKKAGFDHIAVNLDSLPDKSENGWKNAEEHILSILEALKLECVQTHLPCYELLVSSDELDDKMESDIKTAIKVSANIGAPWCVYHPRSNINAGFATDKNFEDNRKVLSQYLDIAIGAGTGIAVENIPIFCGIVPIMPFYCSNIGDHKALVDSFNDEKIRICWDFGHANLMKMDQSYALEYLGKRIVCTHVHNNNGRDDTHTTPDQGNINWEKIMPAMKFADEDCPLTLETHCNYVDDELLKSFASHNLSCLNYLENLI